MADENAIIFQFPCSFLCVQLCAQSDDGIVKQSVRHILLHFSRSSAELMLLLLCALLAKLCPTMFIKPIVLQLCIRTDPGGFKPCSKPMPTRTTHRLTGVLMVSDRKMEGNLSNVLQVQKKSRVMTERTTREPCVPGMPPEKQVAIVVHS